MRPNYTKIYEDLVKTKYPHKLPVVENSLKNINSFNSVIKINQLISSDKDINAFKENQKGKVYDEPSIIEILEYQKKYRLNNSETSIHFCISRNTLARWKKIYKY